MGAFLFGVVVLLCCGAAWIVGDIAAVTTWIPHAGHHGHAPSILGYIGLYALTVALNACITALVIGSMQTAVVE